MTDIGKLAFLFLVKDSIPHIDYWQHFLRGHQDSVTTYVHSKTELASPIPGMNVVETVPTEWGYIFSAIRMLLRTAIDDAQNKRFVIVSESCVPIVPFDIIFNRIMSDSRSIIAYRRPTPVEVTERKPQSFAEDVFWKQSTWMSLNREHATLLCNSDAIAGQFSSCFMADEHLPISLIALNGQLQSVVNREITFADWQDRGAHPRSFESPLRSGDVEAISVARSTGCLFARKFPASTSLTPLRSFVRDIPDDAETQNENCREEITFIVSNYNLGHVISDCLDSIVAQSSSRWRCLIVDDGSTDGSVDVIHSKLKQLADSRIKFFPRKENRGTIFTLSELIKTADTDIVGILDADDALHPNCAEMVLKRFTETTTGFVYTNFLTCDSEMRPLSNGFSSAIPPGESALDNDCIGHFKAFRRTSYFRTSGVDDAIVYAEDKDLIYRLEEVTRPEFINLPLYRYRTGRSDSQGSGEKARAGIENHEIAKLNAFWRRLRVAITRSLVGAVPMGVNSALWVGVEAEAGDSISAAPAINKSDDLTRATLGERHDFVAVDIAWNRGTMRSAVRTIANHLGPTGIVAVCVPNGNHFRISEAHALDRAPAWCNWSAQCAQGDIIRLFESCGLTLSKRTPHYDTAYAKWHRSGCPERSSNWPSMPLLGPDSFTTHWILEFVWNTSIPQSPASDSIAVVVWCGESNESELWKTLNSVGRVATDIIVMTDSAWVEEQVSRIDVRCLNPCDDGKDAFKQIVASTVRDWVLFVAAGEQLGHSEGGCFTNLNSDSPDNGPNAYALPVHYVAERDEVPFISFVPELRLIHRTYDDASPTTETTLPLNSWIERNGNLDSTVRTRVGIVSQKDSRLSDDLRKAFALVSRGDLQEVAQQLTDIQNGGKTPADYRPYATETLRIFALDDRILTRRSRSENKVAPQWWPRYNDALIAYRSGFFGQAEEICGSLASERVGFDYVMKSTKQLLALALEAQNEWLRAAGVRKELVENNSIHSICDDIALLRCYAMANDIPAACAAIERLLTADKCEDSNYDRISEIALKCENEDLAATFISTIAASDLSRIASAKRLLDIVKGSEHLILRLAVAFPDDPGVLEVLGDSYLQNEQFDSALQAYSDSARLSPNPEVLHKLKKVQLQTDTDPQRAQIWSNTE